MTYEPVAVPIRNQLPMFSGLTPLNNALLDATFLGQPIVHPADIVTYFSGFINTVRWVPKYVASADPISCLSSDCSALFLPGGMEQMRPDLESFNGTLLSGDWLQHADAVISHNTTSYQLDISSTPSFNFTSTNCSIYGYSSGEGLYLCVSQDDDGNIVLGRLNSMKN